MSNLETGFYVTGGTVPLTAPSYVARKADEELYASLRQGRFCYVLTSRQMGKSSLMNHVADRLRGDGVAVAELDLTGIGQNLTLEQWYDGLVYELGRELGLKEPLKTCWNDHASLGPLHRFLAVLREGVLAPCLQQVVLFVDEIEVVRSLPFSTDEFFAAIRECYNRRTADPAMRRLTFCLVGMATPADLIQDTRITPFNIGRRIELTDFTAAESAPLAEGLRSGGRNGRRLLRKVLYWTNGHPYLTQRLCDAVANDPSVRTASGVDRHCATLFLSTRAREVDTNLVPVREYLLRGSADLAGLLERYRMVLSGRRVADDETDPQVSLLRLSGIARAVDSSLRVRNRIYERVFDLAWVAANTPDAEWRRQRAAYRRGLRRATVVSAVIVAIMSALIWWAVTAEQRAALRATDTRHLLYVADMNVAQQALVDHNVTRVMELLGAHRDDAQSFAWRYLWRSCHHEMATCRGHTDGVLGVAFSPDGRRLATGSVDRTVKVWDAQTGQELKSFHGHTQTVTSIAFSPNGRWLATGSADMTARLWNVDTGEATHTLRGHTDGVFAVTFSPDGRRLATASGDHTIKIWNVATGQAVRTLHGHTDAVSAVAFSRDGKWLASGSADKTARLWNAQTGQVIRTLHGHTDYVSAVAFSPDGKWLATGSWDHTVQLWNPATGQWVRTVGTHTNAVLAVAFAPEGGRLATAGRDNAVKIWDMETRQEPESLDGHTGSVTSIAFSPDGQRLATGSWDSTARVWEVAPERDAVPLQGYVPWMLGFAFSPDGRRLASVNRNTVRCWDATNGRAALRFHAPAGPLGAIAFSPGGRRLAIGSDMDTISVYDAATGRRMRLLRAPIRSPYSLAFSPDGRWMAAGYGDGTVQLWSLQGAPQPRVLRGHLRGSLRRVAAVAFSPDGKRLATGSWDNTAEVWDLVTQQRPQTLNGHQKPITTVAFSPDGRTLATGSVDDTVKLWDLATGREILTLTGCTREIAAVAFADAGATLKAVSGDGTIRFWRAAGTAQIAAWERAARLRGRP